MFCSFFVSHIHPSVLLHQLWRSAETQANSIKHQAVKSLTREVFKINFTAVASSGVALSNLWASLGDLKNNLLWYQSSSTKTTFPIIGGDALGQPFIFLENVQSA